MRYCRFCRHISAGTPSHCGRCGRSYNTKLCRKGHPNVRGSRHCTTCGSTDLSTPQPRPTIGATAAVNAAFLTLIFATAFFLAVFIKATLANPANLLPLMLIGLGLALLWMILVSIHSLWK